MFIEQGNDSGLELEDYVAFVNEIDRNTLVLSSTEVPLRYAQDWDGGTAIGGFGFWVQDCVILDCPDCGKPMKYLAQVKMDCICGFLYIEICKECQVTAVQYQQT